MCLTEFSTIPLMNILLVLHMFYLDWRKKKDNNINSNNILPKTTTTTRAKLNVQKQRMHDGFHNTDLRMCVGVWVCVFGVNMYEIISPDEPLR